MTATQTNNYIKTNWLTLTNLVVLLTLVFNFGYWKSDVENDIEVLKIHANDELLHMPLDKKIKTFVLKENYDSNITEMKTDIKEIKTDIKAILKGQ